MGISEIDIPAILSYASIHDGLDKEDESFVYPSKEEMIEYLEQRNIGLDFKTKKIKLPKNLIKLQQIYRATVLSKCFGDISLIDPINLPDMDLFTYSFPCTDISVAGQQQGVIKGQTRSGLLYECEKIIEVKRPKYLLMENVKNLVGKKFKEQFDEWLDYLESLGYTNYWQVLNAKDYGVPQNRERVFVVSILNDEDKSYMFPQKQPLDIRLKDVLESQVEDKYYLSDEVQARFKPNDKFKDMSGNIVGTTAPDFRTIGQRDLCYQENSIMGTLVATDYKQPKQIVERVGGCFDTDKSTHQAGSVYNKEGLSPTLDTMQGGYRQPCIMEDSQIKFIVGSTQKNAFVGDGSFSPTLTSAMGTGGGHVPMIGLDMKPYELLTKMLIKFDEVSDDNSLEKGKIKEEIYSNFGTNVVCPRCRTQLLISDLPDYKYLCFECDENFYGIEVDETDKSIDNIKNYRIRKLTPKECWRLMGCSDEDFEKAKLFNSDSQLYKQAGNSIVVNVLEGIFTNMFCKE